MERACRDLAALWQYDDLATVSMCVNLSAAQLAEQGLVERVADALESSGIAPSSLWLEVTETTMLDAPGVDVLEKLRALGVAIAVDDFGTGYAGLQYLKKLPVDAVKLDRSFVAGLGIDTRSTRRSACVQRSRAKNVFLANVVSFLTGSDDGCYGVEQ